MNKTPSLKKLTLLLASLLTMFALLAAVTAPAFAMSTDPGKSADYSQMPPDGLSKVFHHDRLLVFLMERQVILSARRTLTHRLGNRPDLKITPVGQTLALSQNPNLVQAQYYLTVAQGFIDRGEGFDSDEKVVTLPAAIQTLKNIDAALAQARYWLKHTYASFKLRMPASQNFLYA